MLLPAVMGGQCQEPKVGKLARVSIKEKNEKIVRLQLIIWQNPVF